LEPLLSLKVLILENQPPDDIIRCALSMQDLIYYELDHIKFAQCTTNLVLIAFFRVLCNRKIDFDLAMSAHLYKHFGEQIPEKYFLILQHTHCICAGFAKIGNYKMFMKFLDNNYEFNDFEFICYYAGVGANEDIINHLIQTRSFHMTKHIVGAMFYNGNTSALSIVENNKELMDFAHKIITLRSDNIKTFDAYYNHLANHFREQNKRQKI
jgi:hypothetical protein